MFTQNTEERPTSLRLKPFATATVSLDKKNLRDKKILFQRMKQRKRSETFLENVLEIHKNDEMRVHLEVIVGQIRVFRVFLDFWQNLG